MRVGGGVCVGEVGAVCGGVCGGERGGARGSGGMFCVHISDACVVFVF